MGGILEHYRGLCAITAPTVNSYKRFWDFGFWAPIYKDYGWQNRTCLVRVASGGRFEYRAVDSACNPYLTQAALLKAGLDGVKRKLDPGPPQQRNVYDVLDEGVDIPRVPGHLGEALEALEQDEVVRSAHAGPPLRCLHALQAGRVAAVPRSRHRLGARAVPGHTSLMMCGIAGIIYGNGNGSRDIGRDMTPMLQSMKHRGPDSTGLRALRARLAARS